MAKYDSKILGIAGMKCPRCHHGKLYKTSMIEGIYNMHKECPKCKQDFEMEPGFYWGAMYVGYILSSGYMLLGTAFFIWVVGLTAMKAFGVTLVGGIIIVPFTARLARTLWIYTNVRYNKKIADQIAQSETSDEKV